MTILHLDAKVVSAGAGFEPAFVWSPRIGAGYQTTDHPAPVISSALHHYLETCLPFHHPAIKPPEGGISIIPHHLRGSELPW